MSASLHFGFDARHAGERQKSAIQTLLSREVRSHVATNDAYVVVQELAETLKPFDGVVSNNVLPVLKLLQEDPDNDVKYYATLAQAHFTE